MKASELRIGNWVNIIQLLPHGSREYPHIICGIVKGIVCYDGKTDITVQTIVGTFTTDIRHIGSIPITEGVLLKYGFEKIEIPEVSLFGFKGIECDHFILKSNLFCKAFYEYNYNHQVQYIHQLQNLYYSIVSKELIIEL